MKAAVLGTTGYAGMALLRLLAAHPRITHLIPSSTSQNGAPVLEVDRGLSPTLMEKLESTGGLLVSAEEAAAMKPDLVFAALPHLASAAVLEAFHGKAVIIDLSADFRLKDPAVFKQAYGQEPLRPDLLDKAVYGLAEWYRQELRGADLIANPGCYPTATLLPLLPLVRSGLVSGTVVVNALSGISGAGRSAKVNNLFCERSENMNAYSPGTTHRHAAEITQILDRVLAAAQGGAVDLLFTPHLVPLKQGEAITTYVRLAREAGDAEIRRIYQEAYGDSPCIVLREAVIPETRDVRNTNRLDLGWHREGRNLLLFSVIDNLLKGAAGQAVQNMNIRFGFPEAEGLPLHGEF